MTQRTSEHACKKTCEPPWEKWWNEYYQNTMRIRWEFLRRNREYQQDYGERQALLEEIEKSFTKHGTSNTSQKDIPRIGFDLNTKWGIDPLKDPEEDYPPIPYRIDVEDLRQMAAGGKSKHIPVSLQEFPDEGLMPVHGYGKTPEEQASFPYQVVMSIDLRLPKTTVIKPCLEAFLDDHTERIMRRPIDVQDAATKAFYIYDRTDAQGNPVPLHQLVLKVDLTMLKRTLVRCIDACIDGALQLRKGKGLQRYGARRQDVTTPEYYPELWRVYDLREQGKGTSEIADIMSSSVQNVDQRLKAARTLINGGYRKIM